MKSVSCVISLALVSLFLVFSMGELQQAQAQQPSAKAEDTKQAIKVLGELVKSMDKEIAVAQEHKRQLLELRKVLAKGKTSKEAKVVKVAGVGQDTGWLIEHPAQAIGKVYDKYKEAEKAVKEENEANERWLEKQKEAKEAKEKRTKK